MEMSLSVYTRTDIPFTEERTDRLFAAKATKITFHFRVRLFLTYCLNLEDGTEGCPETSVSNYQSRLCNIPEDRRSQPNINLTKHFSKPSPKHTHTHIKFNGNF